jgi:hypothetical protein
MVCSALKLIYFLFEWVHGDFIIITVNPVKEKAYNVRHVKAMDGREETSQHLTDR